METAVKVNYADVVKDILLKEEGSYAVQDLINRVNFDDERKQYLLLTVGTDDDEDVFEVLIAIKITAEGKVKIERNMDDLDLKEELLERGVLYSDIIQ